MNQTNKRPASNNASEHLLRHARQMQDLKSQAQLLRTQAYSDAYEWLGNRFRKLLRQTSQHLRALRALKESRLQRDL
jgi:hypothetical protein